MATSFESAVGRVLARLDEVAKTDFHGGLRGGLRVAGKLGPDLPSKLRIVAVALLLGTKRWSRPLVIKIRGPHGPRSFTLPDYAAVRVLEEVFHYGEYSTPLPRAPRRILDLGSNIGATVLYFATRYPGAEIVGVEASPTLFRLLQANVGDLPNVTLHNGAVSATTEPVVFYEGVSSWEGSTRPSAWVQEDAGVAVEGLRLDDLLGEGATDLIKIDIEGGEFDVLPGSERLSEVGAVLGEIHAAPDTEETRRVLALFDGCEISSTPPDPAAAQYSTVFAAVRPG